MQTKELLALAETICSSQEPPEVLVDLISDYSRAFGEWLEAGSETLLKKPDPDQELELIELSKRHAAVIERSQLLKDLTKKQMTDLKKRGAGILAYTDSSTSRISLTRLKKG